MIAIMKTTSISSIVVSFGSRVWKRMTPSSDRYAPAMIASPRTSSAFARSEPRIEVCATTISPARSAKTTMKSSGRFPSVDCSTPVVAGPKRDADRLRADADRPREQRERDDPDDELQRRRSRPRSAARPASRPPRTTPRSRSTSSSARRDYRPAMATWDTVRELASSFPGVEESTTYGQPAFKVKGKLFAWVSPDRAAEGALARARRSRRATASAGDGGRPLLPDAALRRVPDPAHPAGPDRPRRAARADRGLVAPASATAAGSPSACDRRGEKELILESEPGRLLHEPALHGLPQPSRSRLERDRTARSSASGSRTHGSSRAPKRLAAAYVAERRARPVASATNAAIAAVNACRLVSHA